MPATSPFRSLTAGVCALVLTVGLARFAYTPLLPVMQAQTGLSDTIGGWLATFNYAGYIAGALLATAVGEPRARHRLYRAGLLAALLGTGGMGLTSDAGLWAALRFMAGLGGAAGMLLASGMVLDWLVREGRRPELGLHFAGMGLGLTASGLAAVAMAGRLDWAGQWLALGLLGTVLLVPAWAWMPTPAPHPAGRPESPSTSASQPHHRVRWLLAAYFCAGVGYVVSATFLVAVVERQPALAGSGGLVWVLVGLAATPACFVWDRIARGTGQVRALLLAYALQAVSILLAAWGESLAAALLGAALFGASFIGIVSLALAMVGRGRPGSSARAMARLTLSYGAAQMLAPALAGAIAQATGGYRLALELAALATLAGMGLLAAMPGEAREGAGPPSRTGPAGTGSTGDLHA